MSALRRDLVERKLWMVVALLVVGVVAIPLLLLKGASAGGATTPPAPPAAAPTQTRTASTHTTPSQKPRKVVLARSARNPLPTQGHTLSSQPAAQTSGSSSPASSASPPTPSPAPTSAPSMVSPSPAPSTSAASSTHSTPVSPPSTPETKNPTSTIASVAPARPTEQPAAPRSWTIHSVSLRYGKDLSVPVKRNVARLTPLPSIMQPQVMFMGVMADGKSAVFALHAGVGHTGPGLCRPDHTRCSAIVLKAGQTEHLTISAASGARQQVVLRLVRISSRITHSRRVALAAYHHVSGAGQCELDLANPVSYDSATGTISNVARAACERHPNAVPFGYLVTAP